MNLSCRLIVTYFFIIVATLCMSFFTLVLIARPAQSRLVQTRLVNQTSQLARQINVLYAQGASTERILARIDTYVARNNVRVLFIEPGGAIRVDSVGQWDGQQVIFPEGYNADSAINVEFAAGSPDIGYAHAPTPVGRDLDNPDGYVSLVVRGTTDLDNILQALGRGLIVAAIVPLLVSLLLSVLIARSIALPLQRIAKAAGAVAMGNYEHRLNEKQGPPEVKRVATSFNVMVERVETSQQAMRDFVSNVSHELKTPLTSIQGFSQAIMEGATPDEAARRRAAEIIHTEATRMTRMVEDLLDLARIDSGQVVMHKTPLHLAQIIAATVDRLLPQAAQRKIKLVKQWQDLPPILGDGDRLAQVFTNLLDNAVRYTPSGEKITISSRVVESNIEVSIANAGQGIPAQEVSRLFERFYQVDKSRKRRHDGTGLGLAITREIVEAHGGRVWAESIEGIGTKFTVSLPLAATEPD